jgi:hypothetical protein
MKIKNQITKLVVASLVGTVNIISIQKTALADTYRITFKEGPLDIRCPIIYTNTDTLNLELIKSDTCSNISVEELENELGSYTLNYKRYSPYNKRGVLVDVLPPLNMG